MHRYTANRIICRIFMFKNVKRNSMEKISAVEWLEEKWNNYDLNLGKSGFSLLLKQSKEMEKEQLKQLMWDLTEIDMTKSNKGLIIDNRFDNYWVRYCCYSFMKVVDFIERIYFNKSEKIRRLVQVKELIVLVK